MSQFYYQPGDHVHFATHPDWMEAAKRHITHNVFSPLPGGRYSTWSLYASEHVPEGKVLPFNISGLLRRWREVGLR